ncbi:polyprotein [Trubanaman virus]|uniref:Envelopment polyprotein n=1 Tax=Trubanaman virus TaxID=1678230 RepID=A0A0S2ZY54_9VIRU|nr:polyprotein [Trubanaman virus]
MAFIIILMVIAVSYAIPVDHCFTGGSVLFTKSGVTGVQNACIKDDIATYKITVTYPGTNATMHHVVNSAHIKPFVKGWEQCKPLPAKNGNLNIITINKDFHISSKKYACTEDCQITLDKEHAIIKLSSSALNFYSVYGTMQKTGWFKGYASIELINTCENLEISCGPNFYKVHSCFKDHMSCIRYLHGSIINYNVATSICVNIEIIILLVMILIIFCILALLAKTYLCYIMIPIFYPISLIYASLYNKFLKACKICGLSVHPLTSCGKLCVCGCLFESTTRLAIHRKSGICPGYKTLRHSRMLCKSKGCNLLFSIILAVLFLSFVTPITAECIDTQYLEPKYQQLLEIERNNNVNLVMAIILIAFVSFLILLSAIYEIFFYYIIRLLVVECPECNMYHSKIGVTYFGDFTNKCGYCTCGDLEDIEGVKIHKRRPNCLSKYKVKYYKYTLFAVILLIIAKDSFAIATPQLIHVKKCLQQEHMSADCVPELIECKCENPHAVRQTIQILQHIGFTKPNLQIGESSYEIIGNSQSDNVFTKKYLGFLNRIGNCQYIDKLQSGTNQWIQFAQSHKPELCSNFTIPFCECLASDCTIKSVNITGWAKIDSDIQRVLKIYQKIFPGIGSEYLSQIVHSNNVMTLNALQVIFNRQYKNNKQIVSLIQLIKDLEKAHIGNLERRLMMIETSKIKIDDIVLLQNIKECHSMEILNCTDKHETVSKQYTICTNRQKKGVYKYSGKIFLSKDTRHSCNIDEYCHHDFEALTIQEFQEFKQMNCLTKTQSRSTDTYKTECYPVQIGKCTPALTQKNVVKCEDNSIHETQLPYKMGTVPGMIKLTDSGSAPMVVHESKCVWADITKQHTIKLETHDTLENYKQAMMLKLENDLIIHKYKKTIGMPHFKPKYQPISIKGQETDNGIDESYVEFTLPLLSGASTGLHLMHKNFELYDIVVYIKSARLESLYTEIYETGPTTTINVKHNELCTGSCPIVVQKDPNWLSFILERTSRWGCEEFGCMAVNEGCLYGSCNDVIKPVGTVFKKEGETKIKSEICINTPTSSFCKSMDGEILELSDNLELQLEKNEAYSTAELLYFEKNKLYKGDINQLGSYSKKCGNVQMVKNKTHGMGNPRVDYTCHAARRKDVIIRRCFDNNFESCKLLEEIHNSYNHTDNGLIVSDNTKNLGNLKVKIHLGTLEYKLYNEKIDLKFHGKCFGCINCFTNIDCEIEIHVDQPVICEISANCHLMHSRIIINEIEHKYALKAICQKKFDVLSLSICGQTTDISLDLSLTNDKIELDIADQTTYIREKDNSCGTWLCRVLDEGLNLNIFGGVGFYITVTLIIIVCIVFIVVLIYCLLPLCSRVKGVLQKQEYEMLREYKLK